MHYTISILFQSINRFKLFWTKILSFNFWNILTLSNYMCLKLLNDWPRNSYQGWRNEVYVEVFTPSYVRNSQVRSKKIHAWCYRKKMKTIKCPKTILCLSVEAFTPSYVRNSQLRSKKIHAWWYRTKMKTIKCPKNFLIKSNIYATAQSDSQLALILVEP